MGQAQIDTLLTTSTIGYDHHDPHFTGGPYDEKVAALGHGQSDSRTWTHLEAMPSSPGNVAPPNLVLCPFLNSLGLPASVPLLMLFSCLGSSHPLGDSHTSFKPN